MTWNNTNLLSYSCLDKRSERHLSRLKQSAYKTPLLSRVCSGELIIDGCFLFFQILEVFWITYGLSSSWKIRMFFLGDFLFYWFKNVSTYFCCMCLMYICEHECAMTHAWRQRTSLWSCFSHSTFIWVPGIELKLPGYKKCCVSWDILLAQSDIILMWQWCFCLCHLSGALMIILKHLWYLEYNFPILYEVFSS